MIESEAAFEQRCKEINPDGSFHRSLDAQQVRTFRTLAFSMGTPQSPPTEAQFDAFASAVFSAGPTLGQKAMLRHLHFEATTLVVQTYRDLVNQDTSEGVSSKKLPVPEKRARLNTQQARLGGIAIEGELEPAYQLLDATNQQYESGVLVWLPPSKCPKREVEIIAGFKEKPGTVQVENNMLKVGAATPALDCDISDSLRVQWAWMRRGIAYDQCRMISWSVHQRWIQKLLDSLSQVPPPGYAATSIAQCLRADKELFLLMAREAVPPFKVNASGISPLDAHVARLSTDPRIQQHLLPVPKSVAPAASSTVIGLDAGEFAKSATAKRAAKAKAMLKAKAKAGPKNKPEALKKYDTRTPDGNQCWDFNLDGGCDRETKKNGKGIPCCEKGLHTCACCKKAGHSLVNCRAKKE